MAQNNLGAASKHMKAFWPLTIIFVVAVIAAGLIYWFQFSLNTDYDLQSMVITVHRRTDTHKAPVTKVQTSPKPSIPLK